MGPSAWERLRVGIVPGVFLLLAAWICFEALQVPLGGLRMPGAGFFPLALGLTLAVLSVMLLALNMFSPADGRTGAWPERREVCRSRSSVSLPRSLPSGSWPNQR